jgi:predicted PurR-regulated permease PerM
MKYFKFAVINIIAFSLLFFLFSLLFPSQVVSSKAVSIISTKEKIKKKLSNTADWKNWNVFIKENGVEKNVMSNSDTLYFSFTSAGHKITNTQFAVYEEQTASVLLNWNLTEKLLWYQPWKKFAAMVSNKQVAAAMETSLNNLKEQIEAGK